jgi:hypothetical protein
MSLEPGMHVGPDKRSSEIARRLWPGARSNRCMTGNKSVATRALLSVPSGRGTLTRFQRCWRYCAAFDANPGRSINKEPGTP